MKRHAPATLRNRVAIAGVLELELPASGTVLEIASGSGEHALFFAEKFLNLSWQPSDGDREALASIDSYRQECGPENLAAPLQFYTTHAEWPITQADAIFCANMVHISEWESTRDLFQHAGKLLALGAPLILYGPFLEDGIATAPSNLEFNHSLRARNPAWGIRSLTEIDALAEDTGFARTARHAMPANNLTLVYRRA